MALGSLCCSDVSLSPVAAPEGHARYMHLRLLCEPALVQSNPLPWGRVCAGFYSSATLMVLTSGVTSFALMLPDLRIARRLYSTPKLGMLLLYPLVSLNITALSFCPFDMQHTSLLSFFTLFLGLFFCGFFFFFVL